MSAGFGPRLHPVTGVAISVFAHLALAWGLGRITPTDAPRCGDGILDEGETCDDGNTRPGDGCSPQCALEIELVDIPPPEPPPKQAEPPPEPPPESVTPPEPPPEPPPRRPKPKTPDPPPPPPAAAPPPPAPIELPVDQVLNTGSGSPVQVVAGTQSNVGAPGAKRPGAPGGKPGGSGRTPAGSGTGQTTGPVWSPKGDLYIAELPKKVQVPRLECPAVLDMGISGEVLLRVQVRKDGSIRSVSVKKGIGHGCDAVARKALRSAKFKPALGTDGRTADYELVYTYVFDPPN